MKTYTANSSWLEGENASFTRPDTHWTIWHVGQTAEFRSINFPDFSLLVEEEDSIEQPNQVKVFNPP